MNKSTLIFASLLLDAALARLEVQLRWAVHEDAQRGWRAARPFVQLAELFAGAAAAPSAP